MVLLLMIVIVIVIVMRFRLPGILRETFGERHLEVRLVQLFSRLMPIIRSSTTQLFTSEAYDLEFIFKNVKNLCFLNFYNFNLINKTSGFCTYMKITVMMK